MGNYLGSTKSRQQEMLLTLGLSGVDELFRDVPQEMKLDKLNLPEGKSEMEVRRAITEMAGKNRIFDTIFRGAGAYNHYIPALVKQVESKEEFITAYTPYQPEISQGLLQSIFEYQTMICELTGLDASNASVYDGASAAAEAVGMCVEKKKKRVLLSAALNPMTLRTVRTYYAHRDVELVIVPEKNGVTDMEALKELLDEAAACLVVQQPNCFGCIEPSAELAEAVHGKGGKFVMSVNPLAIAVLPSPGETGADIAVGDAQPLGLTMSFGGPYIGFMAATEKMMRKLPGRIVGETTDVDGKRAFVLTLQAREQHIRREKASSNICSNQAHCALIASVYMSVMGEAGMHEAAMQSYSKAHYMAERLTGIPGVELAYQSPFFHEFVTKIPADTQNVLNALEAEGILGGLPVENGILWCVTEQNTKEEIDKVINIVRGCLA